MSSLHFSNSIIHFLHATKNPHRHTASATAAATTRRSLITTLFITTIPQVPQQPATAAGIELRLTVPDQTVEEAQTEIRTHAQSLLGVKDYLTVESWKEAQKLLRKSSSLLKQDIYTIIQAKPPDQRPELRRLYANLFNGVTKLDYAARDKDRVRVWDCYQSIVLVLDDILSRLLK